MGTKRSERRQPKLRKETIRKLDLRQLAPDDLAKVAGGGYKASAPCTSMLW